MPFGIHFGFPRRPPLPTSCLYGLEGHYPRIHQATRKMGEVYQLGEAALVVRCGPAVGTAGDFHVLLDDDFEAAFEDDGLPEGYRRRLREAWDLSAMRTDPARVAAVIVPSARLEEIHLAAGRRVIRIDPSWNLPKEFPQRDFAAGQFQVAFLGTRSHLADLDLLRVALTDPGRGWEFHHFLGKAVPGWLAGCGNVIAHKALPWNAYSRVIGKLRFHLCVYPMRDTAFNAARSCNKIMEHSMTGAASLYSTSVPFAEKIRSVSEQLLVPDDGWKMAIANLAAGRDECMRSAMASHAAALHLADGARARQAEIWRAIARGDGLHLPPF